MYNLEILYVENKYASMRIYEIRMCNIPHYELLEIQYAHKRIRRLDVSVEEDQLKSYR